MANISEIKEKFIKKNTATTNNNNNTNFSVTLKQKENVQTSILAMKASNGSSLSLLSEESFSTPGLPGAGWYSKSGLSSSSSSKYLKEILKENYPTTAFHENKRRTSLH